MKHLSLWAHHHKWSARLLIVVCYFVLHAAGLMIGDLLLILHVHVSALSVYLFVAAAMAAFILYPSRKEKHRYHNYYVRQKTCDGILIATTFLLVISAANLRHGNNTPFSFSSARAVAPVSVSPARILTKEPPEKKSSFFQKLTTRFTHTFQKVRHWYQRLDTRDKIILTTLLALAAGLAMYGVISWACSLSCSGSEATGWIVLVAGTGVVLFLVLLAGRTINRLYRRRKEHQANAARG